MSAARTPAWKALEAHFESVGKEIDMRSLFAADPERFDRFSATFGTIGHSSLPLVLLDYSKNRVTKETMDLLLGLAKDAKVDEWRDKLFHGEKINVTYVFLAV